MNEDQQIEAAQARIAASVAAGIAEIQAGLTASGAVACRWCQDQIEPARLKALPSAKSCIDCAHTYEEAN